MMKQNKNQARIWLSVCLMILLVLGSTPIAEGAIDSGNVPAAPAEVDEINSLWYVGDIDTPGYADDVKIQGDYAYIADGDFGLRIIDISDPTLPVELGVFDTPSTVTAVDVVGSYAYVIENQWLYVVDISNPELPSQASASNTSSVNYDIVVAGNYAYIGTGWPHGFAVWNISNPTIPFQAGFCPTSGYTLGVSLSGSYAYLATSYHGLNVISISNPYNPIEVGTYDMNGGIAEHVDVEGDYAYLAAGFWTHLRIIDVSNPANPVEVNYYETPGDPLDVITEWGFAYVADTNGVRSLDISDPEAPFMVGSYPSSGTANGLDLCNGYIYVANGSAGLLILRDSFSISGWVKDADENPIEGVTITATGGYTAITDGTGAYGFIDLEAGTYTLTASKEGYTFAPESLEVTLPPNAVSQDFIGTLMTYSISGCVKDADENPIEGVTISATGGYTAVTDAMGAYSITDLGPGIYTLTASKNGYSFEPISREVTLPPDAIAQDFVGTYLISSISGRVTEADGTPIAAVTLSITGGYSTMTDFSGEYSLSDLPPGSYTIIPSKASYNFTPESLTITLPPDATDQDFVGDTFRRFLPISVK